ncbi:hypothetical protein [Paraburkholderia kirstenboschensis]|uniref:hypothetical protein n=1 Tax=Paraburkholderia kirstenboschensis TaxID=1245436 RepID=UPI000B2E29E3|nr:hypothetical protein [Paraburkholderia kirstenboschensis]
MDSPPDGQRIVDSLERDITHVRAMDAALKASLINRLDELREILGQPKSAA